MYMSLPQLEQIIKDRHASAQHSARLVGSKGKHTGRVRRVRITLS